MQIIPLETVTRAVNYIDPGTGSIVIQVVAGVLFTVLASVGIFWSKIKNFFLRRHKDE